MSRLCGLRRVIALAAVLGLTALVVPPSAVRDAPASLVKLERVRGVDYGPGVVWVLLLGSDARPGQPILRSRADAIQLVGLNTATGAATAIGIPRDSYVEVPGYGGSKINSALTYGGPELMARAVAGLVGVQPDYVFTTGFVGFRSMVRRIGGITVRSRLAFSDPVMTGRFRVGENRVDGPEALTFSRSRKYLPGGDFDRSANQQRTLRGILAKVRGSVDRPGFMEGAVFAVFEHLDTNLSPAELFRLAQAATSVEPAKFRTCVLDGGVGYVGAASVVFPDVAQARRLGDDARADATLTGPC